jgi:hypothetical protein
VPGGPPSCDSEIRPHRDVALRADARVSDSADSIGPLDAMRLRGPSASDSAMAKVPCLLEGMETN